MNAKLLIPLTIACCWLTSSPALAQTAPSAGLDPRTGLPIVSPIDPGTGLPPEPQWIDPNWSDPGITLDNVDYDGLPLSEVIKQLRGAFKGRFNILPVPQAFNRDWGSEVIVRMQLKNVKASEVFNAMNLIFENDRSPVRWELKNSAFGGLPYAQLRVLPQGAHWNEPEGVAPPAPVIKQRMVYYVGNLIGDGTNGGMKIEQVGETILKIWPKDFGDPNGVIQFHDEAQLLVVNGNPDQIAFIHQTLAALEQKMRASRAKSEDEKNFEEFNNVMKTINVDQYVGQLSNLMKSLKSLGENPK